MIKIIDNSFVQINFSMTFFPRKAVVISIPAVNSSTQTRLRNIPSHRFHEVQKKNYHKTFNSIISTLIRTPIMGKSWLVDENVYELATKWNIW